MNVSEKLNWEDRREPTCSSSGSGSGKELIRYSICLAFTIKSVTSSFLFADRHNASFV